MTPARRPRSQVGPGGARRLGRALAATAAALVAALVAGCAAMPTAGPVRQGGDDVVHAGDIGIIAAGPDYDAEPDAIVSGFLLAAQAGPTSAIPFAVAREYLVGTAQASWQPYAQVFVLDGPLRVGTPEVDEDRPNRATVRATGTVVASVDQRGVYTEEPTPSRREAVFELARIDGQWRIIAAEDGLLVPAQVFTSTFHRTRLYFPTSDRTQWIPDQRWFPQQTWRTNAVQELLAGPPEWMEGAAASTLPAGTALSINSVTVDEEGSFQVPLTDHVRNATGEQRGLFAAQVRATLGTGSANARVTLLDSNGPVVPVEVPTPRPPRTAGQALVLHAGRFWNVAGRELVINPLRPDLTGLEPTALALSADAQTVVLRDGVSRIVRVSGDEPEVLLEGASLVAPSVDRFGAVWTGENDGTLQVILPGDDEPHVLDAHWLEDRQVLSIAVSPEGSRLAVVSTGADGTLAQVAGIIRDDSQVPLGLATTPVTVGPSVRGVRQAVWQDEITLALLAGTGADAGVYLAGIGGLGPGDGGLTRKLSGVTNVSAVAAAVGQGTILALDAQGMLLLHQTSSVWPAVSGNVDLIAFPG